MHELLSWVPLVPEHGDRRDGALDADAAVEGAREVRELGRKRDVDGLIAYLRHPGQSDYLIVRAIAALRLGRLREERAVAPVTELLSDSNEAVRAVAASVLGQIGSSKAIDGLLSALEDSSVNVRASAAKALGKLRAKAAVQPLLRELGRADGRTRRIVSRALLQIGDPAAAVALQKTAQQEPFLWRWRIRLGVQRMARRGEC